MQKAEETDHLKPQPTPLSGGLADRLLAVGKDCAARLREPYRSADHDDLLYDARGLPPLSR